MKHKTQHIKFKKYSYRISWFFIAVIVVLFVGANALRAIPKSWAAEVTMEVYQQKDGKIFGTETILDIFNNPKLGGKKLVAPFTKGSYTFAVHNNSNSKALPYTLNIKSENPNNIPLVFNIEKNGNFIFGGAGLSNMSLFNELDLPESFLDGNMVDLYTLNWEWKTESDEIDTAIGNDGTQLYKLIITARGSIEETESIIPTDTPSSTESSTERPGTAAPHEPNIVPNPTDTPIPTSTPETVEPTFTPEPTETIEPEETSEPEPTETSDVTDVVTPDVTNMVTPETSEPSNHSGLENETSRPNPSPETPPDLDYENVEDIPESANTPPTPTKPTNTVVLQHDGSYLEIDENNIPLGYWKFDVAQNKWFFEKLEANSSTAALAKELPQTGLLRWPIRVLLIFGIIVLLAGFIIIIKNKRNKK